MISVCIPTYNGGKYLDACLQSVCAQTFTDFEIIICDDCSGDNTLEIIKAFQQKDKRVKLFVNEKNLGLVGNWNKCIELAKGKWIKFVFQDDLISLNCLQKMLQVTDNNSQLVVCEREFIFEENVSLEIRKKYDNVPRIYQSFNSDKTQYFSTSQVAFLINKYAPANFIGEPTSILFRKSITDKIGVFNYDLNQICDLEYWLRISTLSGFVYIPEKLTSFRVHNESTTQKNDSEKHFTTFFSDRIIIIYLLLFSSLYKQYRKYSSFAQLFNQKYTLFYIIYHANLFAKNNGEIIQKEMQLLKEKYPKIGQMQNQYYFYAPLNIAIRPFRRLFVRVKNKKRD
jgi:glycosyltransferase involved in cell wall biosynthesis